MRTASAALLAALLLSTGPADLPAAEGERYLSAQVCATCHRDIYDSWSRTFHALAVIDPVFQESFQRVRAEWGEENWKGCLKWVSPRPSPALSGR